MSLSDRVTRIERERDVYRFYLDGGEKCYVFDLDKKEIVGVSGKVLKSTPSNADGLMHKLGYLITCGWYSSIINYHRNREYIDRIIASNDFSTENKLKLANYFLETSDNIGNCNWKQMLKDFKRPAFLELLFTYNSYARAKGYEQVCENCEKYNIPYKYLPLGSYFNADELAEFMKVKIVRENIKSVFKNYETFKNAIESFYTALGTSDRRLIYNFYSFSMPDEDNIESKIKSSVERVFYNYREVVRLLTELEMTDYEITSIANDLEYLKDLKEERRQAANNAIFSARQTEYDLNFEDDNYKIFVPMNYKDCAKIGKYFSNCAGGYEWNNYLISDYIGYRHLVVVVEKATNKYKVCTDIDNRNLEIIQYLKEHNNSVENKGLLAFKNKYQKYLNDLRKKGE